MNVKRGGGGISVKLLWNTIIKTPNQLFTCRSPAEEVACIFSYMCKRLNAGNIQEITLSYCSEWSKYIFADFRVSH